MKADVYRNLNENCYSVRSRERHNYGEVVDHEDLVCMRDVEFVVQPAGRQRVLDEETKNVHAFARGEVDDSVHFLDRDEWVSATYDPYERDEFYLVRTDEPVESAELAILDMDGIWVPKP